MSAIVEVTAQNFQAEVVDKSKQTPVLVEVYADEAPPSRELAPVLRRLADEYGGKFILARLSVPENQQLVQQLGVRTLPTIKVIFQGQMVENLEGPQQEAVLRQLLDQLTMSPIEMIRSQVVELLALGNRGAAIDLLHQAINEEPKNYALQAELCDLMIMEGRSDEARLMLAGIPDDTEGLSKPKSRLEFMEMAAELPTFQELRASVAADPADLQIAVNLAVRLVANDEIEDALECLLAVLKTDKTFGEEIARRTMIKIFDLLGKGNELATSYRRKMFTFLH